MTLREKINVLYTMVAGETDPMDKGFQYTRPLSIILAAGMLIGGSFYGYRWNNERKEKNAQKMFADCMHDYAKAQKDSKWWSHAEQLFKLGYEENSSTNLAPYFLVYQADALVHQGKQEEAVRVMDEAMKKMPRSSSVYTLYETKHALMHLDMPAEKDKQAGLTKLIALSKDDQNIFRDQALYYVGLYHWSKNDLMQAKQIWQELAAMQSSARADRSPWAAMAEQKIQQIV